MNVVAQRWQIGGRVQGVGFRPFIYRLACAHQVTGWVRNNAGAVEIHAEGPPGRLQAFESAMFLGPPPTAHAELLGTSAAELESGDGFRILPSGTGPRSTVSLPLDRSTCDECLAELQDPSSRRYRYPFINCTGCGPRYTIIEDLPYDRSNTTLDCFTLCESCGREYSDPLDRRFHAQPLACERCGPELCFEGADVLVRGNAEALRAAVALLRVGRILGMRGVGGYHLLCDAANEAAVSRLRDGKGRPAKPLAVMTPWQGSDGLDAARSIAQLSTIECSALVDDVRPIVLVRRRASAALAGGIAPGLETIGVMLPSSPLHHLLSGDFDGVLVATSGNMSGEPVLTDPDEARSRLRGVADGFLHHNRRVSRPVDDPVMVHCAGAMRSVRLGRGTAPLELRVHQRTTVPTLALGAYSKTTIALAWADRVVVSAHIGDLSTPRGRSVLFQTADDLQRLYDVRAMRIVHDAHPGFPTTRWAQTRGLPSFPVWHHHAHASAVAGEYPGEAPLLCFTWDGVGLGPDGSLWGGEALLGRPGNWRRAASFRPFRLPGGERASRHPWRCGLALCWESGHAWERGERFDSGLLRSAFDRGLNAPVTTAVGRLFDAAAALVGACSTSSYEGEAAMRLEALCQAVADPLVLPLVRDAHGVWRSDWTPLVPVLLDNARMPAERSAVFHATLARAVCDQAVTVRNETGVQRVGLCGGVFQNRCLSERSAALLTEAGFEVLIPVRLPVNDAAISFGQLVEAAQNDVPAS